MGDTTNITTADSTFNPWTGCAKVSEGCRNCFAEDDPKREKQFPNAWGVDAKRYPRKTGWNNPKGWNRTKPEGHRVLCGTWCDVFDSHPVAVETRPRLWNLVRETPRLCWMLYTKRPENIIGALPEDWGQGYPNVMLGVSIEHQATAGRADFLRQVPAVKRFISYEPALGPLVLDLTGFDLVIYGGETGKHYRPDSEAWLFSIKTQCAAAGVEFYLKQRAGLKQGRKQA